MADATEDKMTAETANPDMDADEASFFSSKPTTTAQETTASKASAPTEDDLAFHIDVDEALSGLEPEEDAEGKHISAAQIGRGGGSVAAFITLAFSLVFLVGMRGEATYWMFGPSEAVIVEEAQASDAAFLDRHRGQLVRLSGAPGESAVRFKKRFSLRELVAVKGTAVLIERPATNVSDDTSLQAPPDRTQLNVSGKLVRNDDLEGAYEQAFGMLVRRGEAVPEKGHFYLVFEGDIPRHGVATPGLVGGLVALAIMNFIFLMRRLFRRSDSLAENENFTSENTTSRPHS